MTTQRTATTMNNLDEQAFERQLWEEDYNNAPSLLDGVIGRAEKYDEGIRPMSTSERLDALIDKKPKPYKKIITKEWMDEQHQKGLPDRIKWLSESLAWLEAGNRSEGFSEEMAQESIIGLKKRITELKKEIK